MVTIFKWFKEGIIDEKEYRKMEASLAKKYGIKDDSIFRTYNLNKIQVNGMYIHEEKEASDNESKDNRTVTKIV